MLETYVTRTQVRVSDSGTYLGNLFLVLSVHFRLLVCCYSCTSCGKVSSIIRGYMMHIEIHHQLRSRDLLRGLCGLRSFDSLRLAMLRVLSTGKVELRASSALTILDICSKRSLGRDK